MKRWASSMKWVATSSSSSQVIASWLVPSLRIGVTLPRRPVTPPNLVRLWEVGNSPIPRMACSPSTSMSTRPMRIWPVFLPAGLMATVGAKLRGAGLIIGVEAVPSRRELARTYGADVIADFSKEDVVQRILDLTDGQGVDTAIEALGADITFQNAIKVTKAGGTISNVGYHGHGDFVHIPRIEWGVGMAEKTITTGLCPGGRLRMERLLRVLEMKRVDPTLMTTHTFPFDEMERAFEIMDKKLDGVLKPLIVF